MIIVSPCLVTQTCPTSGQIWSSSSRLWLTPNQSWSTSVNFAPTLVEVGPNLALGQISPSFRENALADFGPRWAERGHRANPGRFRAKFGRVWDWSSEFGRVRTKFGRCRAEVETGRHRPKSRPKVGQVWAKLDECWAEVVPNLGTLRLRSIEFAMFRPNSGQIRAGVGHIWRTSVGFGPSWAKIGPHSEIVHGPPVRNGACRPPPLDTPGAAHIQPSSNPTDPQSRPPPPPVERPVLRKPVGSPPPMGSPPHVGYHRRTTCVRGIATGGSSQGSISRRCPNGLSRSHAAEAWSLKLSETK